MNTKEIIACCILLLVFFNFFRRNFVSGAKGIENTVKLIIRILLTKAAGFLYSLAHFFLSNREGFQFLNPLDISTITLMEDSINRVAKTSLVLVRKIF